MADQLRFSRVQTLMAGCPEKAFVPSKDGTAEARAKNFAVIDGTDAGEVSMMYFRRPVTKAFAEYVIGLFEQTFDETKWWLSGSLCHGLFGVAGYVEFVSVGR